MSDLDSEKIREILTAKFDLKSIEMKITLFRAGNQILKKKFAGQKSKSTDVSFYDAI